jgi:biopolymer transport protein ExbB/TolQ
MYAVVIYFLYFVFVKFRPLWGYRDYYPSEVNLDELRRKLPQSQDDEDTSEKDSVFDVVSSWVSKHRKKDRPFFWGILEDAFEGSAQERDRRTYLIFPQFAEGSETLMEKILPRRLNDVVIAISPAIGFFGTLLGLIFIFSSTSVAKAHLASSPEFAVGLRVAVLTSLWGLLNLVLAATSNYVSEFMTDHRIGEMKARARQIVDELETATRVESAAGNKGGKSQ